MAEAWAAERELLRPLPATLPEPFDVVVSRLVAKDLMVSFEGRQYAVPFHLVGRHVEVRGLSGKVEIRFEGRVVRTYRRGTPERILIDPTCYEGEATAGALPLPPLGRMGRRLAELSLEGVAQRSIDLYARLAEGFQAMMRQEASVLFRLISYRYGRGSTIMTTNKALKDWPEILAGDEAMATAMLDRLLHEAHVLSVRGSSYRLRDLQKRLS